MRILKSAALLSCISLVATVALADLNATVDAPKYTGPKGGICPSRPMLHTRQALRSDGSQQVLPDVRLPEGKVLYDGKCEPHANNEWGKNAPVRSASPSRKLTAPPRLRSSDKNWVGPRTSSKTKRCGLTIAPAALAILASTAARRCCLRMAPS